MSDDEYDVDAGCEDVKMWWCWSSIRSSSLCFQQKYLSSTDTATHPLILMNVPSFYSVECYVWRMEMRRIMMIRREENKMDGWMYIKHKKRDLRKKRKRRRRGGGDERRSCLLNSDGERCCISRNHHHHLNPKRERQFSDAFIDVNGCCCFFILSLLLSLPSQLTQSYFSSWCIWKLQLVFILLTTVYHLLDKVILDIISSSKRVVMQHEESADDDDKSCWSCLIFIHSFRIKNNTSPVYQCSLWVLLI